MQWNFADYSEYCFKEFGVTPQQYWVETQYGGKNISAYSNIVFRYCTSHAFCLLTPASPVSSSNGHLDPWSGGGVLESVSDSLVAVVIQDGAHHLDLRAATSADPSDVIAARNIEKEHITRWIKEFMPMHSYM